MGLFDKVKSGVQKVKGAYKDWEAKAPEREAKRLADDQRRIEQLGRKEKMLKAQAGVMDQQNRIEKMRQAQFSSNPLFNQSAGGTFGGFGSPAAGSGPFAGRAVAKPAGKKKKKSSGGPKRKEVYYY